MTEAERLLKELVEALEGAFISTWQSTSEWDIQLNAARHYLNEKDCNA